MNPSRQAAIPSRSLIGNGGDGSPQERTGIAELTVTKTTADETALDLTNISFESGAWGSQFDAQFMFELNPNLESLLLQMNEDDSEAIRFPITMIDQQFTAERWKRIDGRVFYVVLQYYPEKLQFKCPVSNPAELFSQCVCTKRPITHKNVRSAAFALFCTISGDRLPPNQFVFPICIHWLIWKGRYHKNKAIDHLAELFAYITISTDGASLRNH